MAIQPLSIKTLWKRRNVTYIYIYDVISVFSRFILPVFRKSVAQKCILRYVSSL